MLKQHSHTMLSLLVIADAAAISVAWLLAYWVRFTYLPVDPSKGVPALADKFLPLLPAIVLAHLVIFYRMRLYRPRRDRTVLGETRDIVKAFFAAVIAVVLIDYALPASNKISRHFLLTYAVIGTSCFALFRGSLRVFLRAIRRRGWNQRTAAIIGSGRAAQSLLHALQNNSWTGIDVAYFLDDPRPSRPDRIRDRPVYGPLSDVAKILDDHPVDSVFIALPNDEADRVQEVLANLQTCMADVRLVPFVSPTYQMRPNVTELDGVPILSLRQTPLYGWNAVAKRAFDLVVGAACLLIAALPMLLIAVLIRIVDGAPVLYRQRRMGLDGREFEMLKFRTMPVDAERDGPVWSRRRDNRRSRLGAFLRRTSLDELPNLFNVLRGEMSLVGPRPERPEFIRQFKHEIPGYMLRHKMKAGMTGYAQVRGYRGDTSLRKRIQYDVFYIRHWSLWLDLRILLQTVFGVWFSRHEA
ncbi:MAG: undecaprenyl-phosphate glucose phosphotransferase [Planctomycetota bacterium]|nr:MAG: undecaprenyl-phosphate glucose phosphotransferase [Planctomycetota bacterium]